MQIPTGRRDAESAPNAGRPFATPDEGAGTVVALLSLVERLFHSADELEGPLSHASDRLNGISDDTPMLTIEASEKRNKQPNAEDVTVDLERETGAEVPGPASGLLSRSTQQKRREETKQIEAAVDLDCTYSSVTAAYAGDRAAASAVTAALPAKE
jgi:hypothetical protein